MQKALSLAVRGEGCVEPNPMVGAVVVREGGIVGQGYYKAFGGPHAEVVAIQRAGELARGAQMYVTLEPCDHYGKTPPCAPMVARAGLARVVAATRDPTSKTPGGGVKVLRDAAVTVEVGLCAEEALRVNAAFFKKCRTGLPLVTAKWAMSSDGKTATRTGASQWISSERSRALVHRLRGRMDAIVVGGTTALRDDPLLTCRQGRVRRTARRVVVCGRNVPGSRSRLVQTADQVPLVLAFPATNPPPGLRELRDACCELLPLPACADGPDSVDPGSLVAALGEQGATNVLVEGGAALLGSFLDEGLVDRVMVFVAPVLIGGRDAVSAVGGKGAAEVGQALRLLKASWRRVGPDMLLDGWLVDPAEWAPAQADI